MIDGGILVLEPDARSRDVVGNTLRALQWKPLLTGSRFDALREARHVQLTAVIADFHALAGAWPRHGGTTELQEWIHDIRQSQAGYGGADHAAMVPIILMTPHENLAEHEAALAAGADLYLSEAAVGSVAVLGKYLARFQDWTARANSLVLLSAAGDVAARAVPEVTARHAAELFHLPDEHLRAASGRWDAKRIAKAMDLELKEFVPVLGANYSTVAKTPDSVALQPKLAPFASVLAMLQQVYGGDVKRVRAWLRHGQKTLGDETPLAVLLRPGGIDGVEQLVVGAWMGEPA